MYQFTAFMLEKYTTIGHILMCVDMLHLISNGFRDSCILPYDIAYPLSVCFCIQYLYTGFHSLVSEKYNCRMQHDILTFASRTTHVSVYYVIPVLMYVAEGDFKEYFIYLFIFLSTFWAIKTFMDIITHIVGSVF
jgi:hypothetical protein